ncbi:GNAT family N-acetyltransferase [Asticcacaulis solisilvae]|uniref:GNAT family N-acetyltransferase n=1 Tax=Asticcacaulis solisilvae TaxID=1217274 RepID=UPI003FD7B8A2
MDIGYATARDKAGWWSLWQAYLDFYNQPLPDEISDLTFGRFLDPHEPMVLLVARDGDDIVGFAALVEHRSTWARNGYVYLEDLFVAESVRGKGAGRKLIEATVDHAKSRHCERVYWVTHDHNATARALYDKVASLPGLTTYFADM